MMYYTHLAFGVLLGLLSLNFLEIDNLLFFFVGLIIGSAFVDIDNVKSKIGRKSLGLSFLFQFALGHRGIFHSLIFSVLFFILIYLLNVSLATGFFIGYLSHLVIDSFNLQGIRLFYPISKYNFKGFIRVNSLTEKLIFAILIVINVMYILKYIL